MGVLEKEAKSKRSRTPLAGCKLMLGFGCGVGKPADTGKTMDTYIHKGKRTRTQGGRGADHVHVHDKEATNKFDGRRRSTPVAVTSSSSR